MGGLRNQQICSLGKLLEIIMRIFRGISMFVINEKFVIYVLYKVQGNVFILYCIDSLLFSTLFYLCIKTFRTPMLFYIFSLVSLNIKIIFCFVE